MHELGLALELIATIEAALEARRPPVSRVLRVAVEVGALSAVLPEALELAFQVACEGTALEGARLELVRTEGRGRCRACGVESALAGPLGLCPCGSCDLVWVAGHELRVREVEVLPCAESAAATRAAPLP